MWEAALNIACTGAEPMALVDNLNFGNPEKPEVMWQFREVVEGISEACEALGIPVIGGNVSFYNETDGLDIYPTPVVGIIGLIEELAFPPPGLDRATEGSAIYVLGTDWAINLAGSAFEKVTFGHVGGRPTAPDPTMGKAVVRAARSLADRRVPVLQDISSGGWAVALAEICIASGIGATVEYQDWRHLWSEDPHRFLAVGERRRPDRIDRIRGRGPLPTSWTDGGRGDCLPLRGNHELDRSRPGPDSVGNRPPHSNPG